MNVLTRTTSVAVIVTLGLALAAGAAEPPKPESGVWVNLALGWPVAVKAPDKEMPQGKGGFAAADLFKEKFADKAAGTAGWGSSGAPVVYFKPGIEEVSLRKGAIKVPARGVVVHPGPDTDVVVGWHSPIAGTVSVQARITNPYSGGRQDGVTWAIKHGTSVLAQGKVARAGTAQVPAAEGKDAEKLAAVPVAKDDTLALVIGRNGSHLADTSFIEALAGNPDLVTNVPAAGRLAGVYVQAISAYAPHPNAAKLWMEYLYSDEGQLIYASAPGFCYPIRFEAMSAAGSIPADVLAALPSTEGAYFPTIDEIDSAKAIITENWPSVVGVEVKPSQ